MAIITASFAITAFAIIEETFAAVETTITMEFAIRLKFKLIAIQEQEFTYLTFPPPSIPKRCSFMS